MFIIKSARSLSFLSESCAKAFDGEGEDPLPNGKYGFLFPPFSGDLDGMEEEVNGLVGFFCTVMLFYVVMRDVGLL